MGNQITLDGIEALLAFEKNRTVRKAALELHLTQSAVSKRIDSLSLSLGKRLTEPVGRNIELTPFALNFLRRARPLMNELKELFIEEGAVSAGKIVIDVSVSVLISWGAKALARVRQQIPGLHLEIGAHHASVAVERVRSGESMLALVQGEGTIAPDLKALPVLRQPLVVIPSGLKRPKSGMKGDIKVLAIEEHTEAWHFTERELREHAAKWKIHLRVEQRVQSFSAITQLAKAGFGHGLVPLGVATTLGIPEKSLLKFPAPGLQIPISLIGRKTTLGRQVIGEFYELLVAEAGGGED